MTTEELKTAARRHRPAALLGGGIGLLLLFSYLGYQFAVTPRRPDPRTARAAEVIAYVRAERGLAALSLVEARQYLAQWQEAIRLDPARKADYASCLEALPDPERKALAEALFAQGKRAFLDDAERHRRLASSKEQYAFLLGRLEEYEEQAAFFKELAASFPRAEAVALPEFQRWLFEHTTEEERELGQAYAAALQRVAEQVRKERRTSRPAGP